MLMSLNIKDVVLIDRLLIEFKSGLCVLTGETGAGKSVLLDALGLALGVRAESGLVRKGAEKASVTAAFQISGHHEALKILNDSDIECDEDVLLMRRVVYTSGKSRAFINDQPVSISLLKQIGDTLVEIHGQFETQGLLNPATHRAMLDEYAGIDATELAAFYEVWKEEQQKLIDLRKMSERANAEEEYLRLSLEDLDVLKPVKGEEEELSSLRERLKHREVVLDALISVNTLLSGDYDPVQHAWGELNKIAGKAGEALEPALEALGRASSEISEASALIQTLLADLQEGDQNLEGIDDRLHALRMQARKHNCAVDDLPQVREKLSRHLDAIHNSEENVQAQIEKCNVAKTAFFQKAKEVSHIRQETGARLNKLVQAELAPLKLEKARFVTQVEPLDEVDWTAGGIDRVRFLVATNPGSEPGAIHKIASGGEMSRFMLALKVIIAQAGSTHSFIFDEVDAGIGGATADAVGERLARLADSKQVLVVTHAPQVAARADHHWIVRKSGDDVVKTDIIPLGSRAERCEEIARMLAGADITPEARAAADKLLDHAA